MIYLHVVSSREVLESFEAANAGELKLGSVESAPEGDGLFFDLAATGSILIWIKENKDVLVAAAGLLTAALNYIGKPKSKSPQVTIVVRTPDDREQTLEITRETTEIEIADKVKKLTEPEPRL